MSLSPDQEDGISNLVQRLDMVMDPSATRIITFISSRPGEGTSTVARDYARALSDTVESKVLLIDAGNLEEEFFDANQANSSVTIADVVVSGKPLADALFPITSHVLLGRWASSGRGRSAATKLLNDEEFWKNLHENFSAVVIDAPSLKESADGIGLAARADATVLVVEAEKTRQPVVENLRDTLTQGGAKIAGIVMNKRRYYIPAKVYQNM